MQTSDYIIEKKQFLIDFLNERLRYFYNEERNPFTEARMVQYINNGLKVLDSLEVDEDTEIAMYDVDGVLQFKVMGE